MSGLVVVTGTAGFIGTHTSHALLDAGYEVLGIDAFTSWYRVEEKRRNAASLLCRPGFHFVEGDLSSLALQPLLAGASAVVHLAAQPGVTDSWGDAFPTYVAHNVLATQRLLEAIVEVGVPRLVAASSSSVYGDAPAYPCHEDVPPRPVSPYGVTKLATEQLCLAYARPDVGDLSTAVLRYFTVYGPLQRPDMAMRRFIDAALAGAPVTVYGDGEQTRDFTYVADAVQATVAAITAPVRAEVFNVGGGFRASVNHALEVIERVTDCPVRVRYAATRPGDVRHTGADCSRAAEVLGYRPQVDLETGLAAEAEWLMSGLAAGLPAPTELAEEIAEGFERPAVAAAE
jgi:nucleoside-diphosphate-sugar epimerase